MAYYLNVLFPCQSLKVLASDTKSWTNDNINIVIVTSQIEKHVVMVIKCDFQGDNVVRHVI